MENTMDEGNRLQRILLVDDEPVDRMAVCRTLAGLFEVVEAENEEEATASLKGQQLDGVILDYHIPGFDTLEFVRKMSRRVPLIILTGRADVRVAVEAMKDGAQDYLTKDKMTREGLHRALINAIDKVRLLRTIEEQRRELERLATMDDLTGLYNHRLIVERMQEEIDRTLRFDSPLSVLMLDLDHFKQINDEFGHLAGDRVLVVVAKVIKETLRRTDTAARYGGEKFCILAVGSDLDGAQALAERLRQHVKAVPIAINDTRTIHMTCSIGVASLSADREDWQRLLERADQALYRAKRGGRDRVVLAGADVTVG
jgi:two-component system cell cycle response regulator